MYEALTYSCMRESEVTDASASTSASSLAVLPASYIKYNLPYQVAPSPSELPPPPAFLQVYYFLIKIFLLSLDPSVSRRVAVPAACFTSVHASEER